MSNEVKAIPRVVGAANSAIGATSPAVNALSLLINSRNPIITVETGEEQRFLAVLERVAQQLEVPLYVWSVTTGLGRMGGAALYNSDQPEQALTNIGTVQGNGVFLLKDFARYCDNDRISRRLRDLADGCRTARRSIVISGAAVNLPAELSADAVPFQLGLPAAEELVAGVRRTLAELTTQGVANGLDAGGIGQLAKNLAGLSEEEALRVLRQCVLARGKADAGLLDDVLEGKRQALHTDGLLETVKRDASFNDVAGLQHLREWIAKRKSALTPEGQRFGLVPPKGILITGVQGCGKSLAARAVAGEWGYELARLDAGALYDKYVGESEKRLRKALDLAQKLAPVVLWIDEIEKAFASAGSSGDADAGLSQRLLATLLTWMQDRESGVFLAATSNNITVLPPEMLRKGRFDEIFFVDLPNGGTRAALFLLHLKKRGRDPGAFDVMKLAAASEGFSGAEIEQAIAAGLYTAFSKKQQLSTEILLSEIQATQPLSVTRAEEVAAIRDWAKSRAVPAD
ncbi:MAG TPA: AAA family ATPase [Candidatus Saccharimonadales bacterium]|nr:AAA family ATPase [Candidatus Saccharimonadales bacterium]